MKKMAESREQECNTLRNWEGMGEEEISRRRRRGYAQNGEFRGF